MSNRLPCTRIRSLAILITSLACTSPDLPAGNDPDRQPDDPARLLKLGIQALRRSDFMEAIDLFKKSAELAPRDSDPYHWLGNGYAWAAATAPLHDKADLGRRCLQAYRVSLDLDPDNLRARFGLMNFYRHVPRLLGGGLGRAYAEAEEIRRRDPVEGSYALAVLYVHEKKHEAAFAALEQVIAEIPTHYAAHCLFGRLALETGKRRAEGEAALRQCLELTPLDTDESHEAVSRYLEELTSGPRP